MPAQSRGMGKRTKIVKEEEPKFLCPYCNKEKKKSDFYISTDPMVMTGVTRMCRSCAEKVARNWDERTQMYGEVTKASLQAALERLDKPYLNQIWDSSYFEYLNDKNPRQKSNIWSAYIKNIGMRQYNTMRWHDGDLFNVCVEDAKKAAMMELSEEESLKKPKAQEINEEYEKNRRDVVRLLGYDPFEKEAQDDKPLLYSQLIGYLDISGENDDMMRVSSAITIVRAFLQQAKIDDKLAKAMTNSNVNVSEIKSLLDSKQKISSTVSLLAEQSCLSLKHNKNASKGENTWTGKLKKIKELNLREGEVNGFDIATCKGMQQVMDLSNASILKQLALDESEYSDIIAEQRKLVTQLSNERDSYKEVSRILLRENLDLRDTLTEKDLIEDQDLINLDGLFSPFSDIVEDDQVEDNVEDGDVGEPDSE